MRPSGPPRPADLPRAGAHPRRGRRQHAQPDDQHGRALDLPDRRLRPLHRRVFGAVPSTTLRVFEGFSSQLLGRLQQGEVDFACCAIPADEEHGGTLLTEPLGTLNYSVVAAATHPVFDDIAKRRPISQYRWVEFDTAIVGAFPGQSDIVSVMATAGRDVARKSVRTASMDVIRLLVLSGDFIGLIADERVAEELENGTLRRVPGTEVTASQFGFVSMAENFETSACKALREILEKSAFEPMRKAH
ncbi:substrate-binding domain-containing protein [Novosphingobium resinovorum]